MSNESTPNPAPKNYPFDRDSNIPYTPEEKLEGRRIILQDVIASVEAGRWGVTTGRYLYIELPEAYETVRSKGLHDLLPESKCSGCALGNMFLAYVDKFNHIAVSYTLPQNLAPNAIATGKLNTKLPLLRYFSNEQLNLIEAAFESTLVLPDQGFQQVDGKLVRIHDEPIERYAASSVFNSKYPDDTERLLAIMNNALRNDTLFCPEQEFLDNELSEMVERYKLRSHWDWPEGHDEDEDENEDESEDESEDEDERCPGCYELEWLCTCYDEDEDDYEEGEY